MLYDKRWDAKVEQKVDQFTLESLTAWLEKQPGEKLYCYGDFGMCLLAQYWTAHGNEDVALGHTLGKMNGEIFDIPASFTKLARNEPHTFGAALDRARAAMRA